MGKTEKIVVLSVLFAIVVLFVWSLDQGEPKAAAPGEGQRGANPAVAVKPPTNPGTPAPSEAPLALQGRGDAPVVVPRPHPGNDPHPAAGPLLAAGVQGDDVPESRGPGVVLQPEWDLVTLTGLEATVDPEMFVAVARVGDTFATLAERYYADAAKARLLERSNEGVTVGVGVAVLVPAVDRLPKTPELRQVEVLEGEGLWHVAKRALGSGARWQELYQANQDRIDDPNQVRAGLSRRGHFSP